MEQKPIILEMDEAKQELVQCVNNIMEMHRLSCYLIEPMFAELYTEIKASARNEIAQARAQEELKRAQTQVVERNVTQVEDGAE